MATKRTKRPKAGRRVLCGGCLLSDGPYLTFYPRHEEIYDARLAFRRDVRTLRHLPPPVQTAAAAGRGRVLRLEHRMSTHGGLPSVVGRIRRRKPRTYEVLGMAADRIHALVGDIPLVLSRELEARAESRPRKFLECCICRWLSHRRILYHNPSVPGAAKQIRISYGHDSIGLL